MAKMKELYEKVAADYGLQKKFAEIMEDVKEETEEIRSEKLISFAKEAGYDVTIEEVKEFFKGLAESKEGELTDGELDMVAGGKSEQGGGNIATSVLSLGLGCAFFSLGAEMATQGGCGSIFK